MKKILSILFTTITIVNASWFPSIFNTSKAEKKEPMLQSTKFSQIENKIGKISMMLEFGATSCHSCVVMGKILYKIKQKYPNAHIYFIDINEDNDAAKKFAIRMIPTQKYLDKSGNVIETHMGVIKQGELELKLNTLGIL